MESSAATTGGQPAFTIVRQDHSSAYDPNDPNATQWTVYFRTRGGTDSQITFPDSEYTAQNVAAKVAARAAQIDAIGGLTSGPDPS